MAIRLYRAYSPGTRSKSVSCFDDLSQVKPQKSLTFGKKSCGGRNNRGAITIKGRGGGHKRKYRIVDFGRKSSIAAKVATIEYDPNRNARVALLHYKDGSKKYVLAPRALKIGMDLYSGVNIPIEIGNAMPLEYIPLGSIIHNVEITLGKGGQIARSAGTYAQLIAKEGDFITLKLPSKEVRLVSKKMLCNIRPS
jgi:large subunit ribosomal protein L2